MLVPRKALRVFKRHSAEWLNLKILVPDDNLYIIFIDTVIIAVGSTFHLTEDGDLNLGQFMDSRLRQTGEIVVPAAVERIFTVAQKPIEVA
jgi:hypothetical protein